MEYGYDQDYACMQRLCVHACFFVGEYAYVLLSMRVNSGSESCACACVWYGACRCTCSCLDDVFVCVVWHRDVQDDSRPSHAHACALVV